MHDRIRSNPEGTEVSPVHSGQTEPTVSVVIPSYNAENTLRRTLDCVLGQTWRQLQVILVDDGSEDGTVEAARRIAEEDDRLTVVPRENLGVSSTRNTGLALCTGKYIRFVDADDTLPEDSIEKMVRRAEQDGAELVIGGYDQYCEFLFLRRAVEQAVPAGTHRKTGVPFSGRPDMGRGLLLRDGLPRRRENSLLYE